MRWVIFLEGGCLGGSCLGSDRGSWRGDSYPPGVIDLLDRYPVVVVPGVFFYGVIATIYRLYTYTLGWKVVSDYGTI